jgi:hypothetical protein
VERLEVGRERRGGGMVMTVAGRFMRGGKVLGGGRYGVDARWRRSMWRGLASTDGRRVGRVDGCSNRGGEGPLTRGPWPAARGRGEEQGRVGQPEGRRSGTGLKKH